MILKVRHWVLMRLKVRHINIIHAHIYIYITMRISMI